MKREQDRAYAACRGALAARIVMILLGAQLMHMYGVPIVTQLLRPSSAYRADVTSRGQCS